MTAYILLKDLPDVKAGEKFVLDENADGYIWEHPITGYKCWYRKDVIETMREWFVLSPPLLVTMDHKPIFEGDMVYYVGKNTLSIGQHKAENPFPKGLHDYYLYFSSIELAVDYTKRHRVRFNEDDLKRAFELSREFFFQGIDYKIPVYPTFEDYLKTITP